MSALSYWLNTTFKESVMAELNM